MDYIRFLRTVRRIEREAARRGYGSDCTIDDRLQRDTGTLAEQLGMAAIGVDSVRLSDLSTRDRELVSRLIRNCVLSSPRRTTSSSPLRRAGRRVV